MAERYSREESEIGKQRYIALVRDISTREYYAQFRTGQGKDGVSGASWEEEEIGNVEVEVGTLADHSRHYVADVHQQGGAISS